MLTKYFLRRSIFMESSTSALRPSLMILHFEDLIPIKCLIKENLF